MARMTITKPTGDRSMKTVGLEPGCAGGTRTSGCRRIGRLALAACLSLTLLTGLPACRSKESDPQPTVPTTSTTLQTTASTAESTPTTSSAPTPSPTPTLIPTPTPIPVLRSPTSGKLLEAPMVYKPVGVMIENSVGARPQAGLQAADVVYEAPVEGCTRFFCIFNDTMPESVGPVRSARLYFVRMQQEWDSAYVHAGGPQSGLSNVYKESSSHIDTRIDINKGAYARFYWRVDEREAPHNAYVNTVQCQEAMDQVSQGRTFQFAEQVQYDGPLISEIVLPFYIGKVTYRYDAASDKLLRYMGSKPFLDADTGAAVAVTNLIVQSCHFYHGEETYGRWLADLTGEGKAEFFIGGKHMTGTWERSAYDQPTLYRDAAGQEIVLRPGNTWIALHPQEKAITVSYDEVGIG